MIYSMTAYTHQQNEVEQGTITVELKSVNHRFLELTLKLSDELRYYETSIRAALAGLLRGKVECRLGFQPLVDKKPTLHYDKDYLETVCATLRLVQKNYPESGWPSLDALLQFPGVLKPCGLRISADTVVSKDKKQETLDDQETQVLVAITEAVEVVSRVRALEGKKIEVLLRQRVDECKTIVHALLQSKEQINQDYLERLTLRLEHMGRSLDQDRLVQEVTVQALRADVCEELDRLLIHLDTVDAILNEGGSVGKRLDFLMQELNREANTLASKAVEVHVSQSALQLKLCIEQMREQIQNLV